MIPYATGKIIGEYQFFSFDGGRFINDIGLIRLASPIKFTKNINPICLSQHGDPYSGRDSIVAGWGVLKEGSQIGSNSLREVHVIFKKKQMIYLLNY